jgi:hypothetical protein
MANKRICANRRELLLGGVAAALVPMQGLAAVTDPHRKWLDEWISVREDMNNSTTLADDDPRWEIVSRLEEKICITPAQTMDGALAQLEFAMDENSGFEIQNNFATNWDGQLFNSVAQQVRGAV